MSVNFYQIAYEEICAQVRGKYCNYGHAQNISQDIAETTISVIQQYRIALPIPQQKFASIAYNAICNNIRGQYCSYDRAGQAANEYNVECQELIAKSIPAQQKQQPINQQQLNWSDNLNDDSSDENDIQFGSFGTYQVQHIQSSVQPNIQLNNPLNNQLNNQLHTQSNSSKIQSVSIDTEIEKKQAEIIDQLKNAVAELQKKVQQLESEKNEIQQELANERIINQQLREQLTSQNNAENNENEIENDEKKVEVKREVINIDYDDTYMEKMKVFNKFKFTKK